MARDLPDDWAWKLLRSFVTGARLSFQSHVPGAGSARVAVLRLVAVGALVGALYAQAAGPSLRAARVAWVSWTAGAVVLTVVGWWGFEQLWSWPHRRRWVRPLDVALRPLAGWPANLPTHKWLVVPRNFREAGIAVQLPAAFVGKDPDRQAIEHVVISKLDVGDMDVSWRIVSRNHFVEFQAKPRPPGRALFREPNVRHVVENVNGSQPVIGLGPGGQPVSMDLDGESPHMAVFAGAGAGTSNVLRVVAAQLMHHGASAAILDRKRRSHRWAKDLDGVTYCREAADIHRALVDLAAEAAGRNRLVDRHPDRGRPVWPRRVILVEDLSSTLEELAAYWRENLGGRDPSPAPEAYRQILSAGPAIRFHILTAAQRFLAPAAEDPGAPGHYGTLVLARLKPQEWRTLLPETTFVPKAGRDPGRGWVAAGGEMDEVQIVYMSEIEARQWAASGR